MADILLTPQFLKNRLRSPSARFASWNGYSGVSVPRKIGTSF